MSSVDIHSQLASIIERFAKGALVEMTKIIDKDSALLRAEIARRQMEVEALLCKLQFAESELRSARQAAATRQSAANRRSIAVQVTITAALQGKHGQEACNRSLGIIGPSVPLLALHNRKVRKTNFHYVQNIRGGSLIEN